MFFQSEQVVRFQNAIKAAIEEVMKAHVLQSCILQFMPYKSTFLKSGKFTDHGSFIANFEFLLKYSLI
ncbi:hypothetical protein JVU11DRAFT_6071 [Chiua virens]|nr:hypothetical protein JVU11DRAFT_6071 [Chiua virens]